MKKEIPYKNADQKRQRSNVDIKARKSKRESIEDIHLHRQINLIAILMGWKDEKIRARKAQIPDLGCFPQKVNASTTFGAVCQR